MLVGCPMPTANISNPRTNTLEVHWNYPNGAGDSVVIEWGSHSVHTATSPYIIEGLNSSTTYTVRVRPLCSDDVTCHSVVLSGTTLDEPADIPYCQLFASYSMPSGWYMWSDSGSITFGVTRTFASAADALSYIRTRLIGGQQTSEPSEGQLKFDDVAVFGPKSVVTQRTAALVGCTVAVNYSITG